MGQRGIKLLRPAFEDAPLQHTVVELGQQGGIGGQAVPVVIHRLIGKVEVKDGVLAAALGRYAVFRADVHQGPAHPAAGFPQAVVSPFLAQFLQGSQAGGAGYGIAVQGANLIHIVVGGRCGLVIDGHQVLPAHYGGQGIAAAHYFAHSAQVGSYAVKLLGAAVGQPKPGNYFVENQRHIVAAGQLPQAGQKAGPGRDNALQRLNDDRRQFVVMGSDDGGRSFQVVERGHQHQLLNGPGDAAAVDHGLGKLLGHGGSDAHQGVVAGAVIAALELQHLFPPAIGPGRPHTLKAGVGAAGGKAHLVGAGDGRHQFFGQQHGPFVGGKESAALADGFGNGRYHRRVGMAQDHRPGAHQPVHILVAAHIPDPGAAPFPGQEIKRLGKVGIAGTAGRHKSGRLVQQFPLPRLALCHQSALRPE